MTILVPTSLNVCFCTTWKNQKQLPGTICALKWTKKTSINFISSNLCPQQPVDYKVWLSCNTVSTR